MFITKLANRESGIILYGITPPRLESPEERISEIGKVQSDRVMALGADGLIIYDLQDETSRTSQQRPFPFTPTLDAWTFADQYIHISGISKIVYCSVGKRNPEQMRNIMSSISAADSLVLVGLPSREEKAVMHLKDAYNLWNEARTGGVLGGVAIAERHSSDNAEHIRLLKKASEGCSYFITQCVYNLEYMRKLVTDLSAECETRGQQVPYMIFTLTPCGSGKTLQFLNWLGINVPDHLSEELSQSENMLEKSIHICLDIARDIAEFCRQKNVPFGFNIESVSARKLEIEASEQLLTSVKSWQTELVRY
ncbi:methylenetetrahydrofolate reductase [Dyadobacter linearis]|nr:methylenetetrahydrofolate reductase [Dyadobacter sp. CECT 9623]